jgi:hypothetical protein
MDISPSHGVDFTAVLGFGIFLVWPMFGEENAFSSGHRREGFMLQGQMGVSGLI